MWGNRSVVELRDLTAKGVINNKIKFSVGDIFLKQTKFTLFNYDQELSKNEPSVFNLDLLAKNIWINKLTEKVVIFPLPLNDKTIENKLKMTNLNPGGSQSTFAKDYGYDGSALNEIFSFSTLGISIDDVCNFFKIKTPNYIKIDVDGIENKIIKKSKKILKSTSLKSILVEINAKREEDKEILEIMKFHGVIR